MSPYIREINLTLWYTCPGKVFCYAFWIAMSNLLKSDE
jgi:hypothetical protein